MKNMRSVEEQVKQILMDQSAADESEIRPAAKLVDDLGLDSLDEVELMMALEDAFEIEIPDAQYGKNKTVQDVIDYVMRRTAALKK